MCRACLAKPSQSNCPFSKTTTVFQISYYFLIKFCDKFSVIDQAYLRRSSLRSEEWASRYFPVNFLPPMFFLIQNIKASKFTLIQKKLNSNYLVFSSYLFMYQGVHWQIFGFIQKEFIINRNIWVPNFTLTLQGLIIRYFTSIIQGVYQQLILSPNLKDFINKVAGHPLVQGERCLHMFLTEVSNSATVIVMSIHEVSIHS